MERSESDVPYRFCVRDRSCVLFLRCHHYEKHLLVISFVTLLTSLFMLSPSVLADEWGVDDEIEIVVDTKFSSEEIAIDEGYVPFDRGSCGDLRRIGIHRTCGTGSPGGGRPGGILVKVSFAQFNCIVNLAGGVSSMFIAPYTIPYAAWRMYAACHHL